MTLAEKLRQEGWDKGRQGGRQEGQRQLLLKLLTLRFGHVQQDSASRISEAGDEDLERWAERVLTASSIDEVLDDQG